MGLLSQKQIFDLGFANVGENVFLSDKASFYGCSNIKIGNNVRIDDYCVISSGSGGIEIGNYIHVAVYSSLIGSGKIQLGDFSNISSRVAVYSSNDDYSGAWMTNPMIPTCYTNVTHADVFLGRHVIIGAGSIVLPGAILGEGVAVGALSLVSGNCEEFGIYSGVPARKIKNRKKDLLKCENDFIKNIRR